MGEKGDKMKNNSSEFLKRRREQIEEEKRKEIAEEMAFAAKERTNDIKDAGRSCLPRRLATGYYEETNSWMHRFSDVRSDDNGFFILHDDNPDAWRMKEGDLLQDVALNETPYWIVSNNERFSEKRVDLEPFGPNPFLTGVGAGGAKIFPEDLKVLTGQYDEERLDDIHDLIRSGDATDIDQVSYALLGTVPTNFGPNGPQGGWYNAGDSWSNRGGRQGIKDRDIVIADAKILRHNGFLVSDAAIDGKIKVHEWNQFVSNPVGYFRDWDNIIPHDFEIFKERQMGIYKRRGLLKDKWRLESLSEGIDAIGLAGEIWIDSGCMKLGEIRDRRMAGEYGFSTENALKDMWRWYTFSSDQEDMENINNAMLMLNYPQSDVQARAAGRCMMYCLSSDDEEGDECYEALMKFLNKGQGNWLVNEYIIKFGEELGEDGVPLLIEATKLPDAVNRKYAYWGLTTIGHPIVQEAIFTEEHPEPLGAIVSAMVGSYGKKRKYLPGRHETYYLLEKLTGLLSPDESTIIRCQARDALASVIPLARRQGLEVERAVLEIKKYDKEIYKNPEYEKLGDNEWIDLTLERMLEVV